MFGKFTIQFFGHCKVYYSCLTIHNLEQWQMLHVAPLNKWQYNFLLCTSCGKDERPEAELNRVAAF